MTTHTIAMKVDIVNLMKQAVVELKTPAISIGFQIALTRLLQIAKRAVEIKDEEILKELELLCLVSEKDKKEKEN